MAATFVAALAVTRAVRPRPFPLEALLAFAAVVAFEALALDVLSAFRAVNRPGVLAAHAIAIASVAAVRHGAALRDAVERARRAFRSVAALGVPGLTLLPLAALIAASAVQFAPNNWDSMTYHLARVAHWIQQQSVEPYPTHIDRQILLMPGGEYLLATLQVVSGGDRLANFVQMASWVLVVLSAPSLARLAGAPRPLAPWAAVIAGSAPMVVLQASSTQNDLVAAALAVAGWVACVPFVHSVPRAWKRRDVVFLAAVLSAATIVKVTALVAVAPMVAVATVRLVRTCTDGADARKLAVALAMSAFVFALVVGPEIARRRDWGTLRAMRGYAETFLYPAMGSFGDRFRNLSCGLVRHVPVPRCVVSACGIPLDLWCGRGDMLCSGVLHQIHEDSAGNPIHVGIAVLAAAGLATQRRRVPPRALTFLGSAAAAWVLFFLVFRDNPWISRLQTPTFVLTGIAVVALAAIGGAPRRANAWAMSVALAALAHGVVVASWNGPRRPFGPPSFDRDATYYANQPATRSMHDAVLATAQRLGCSRLGLMVGGDSYDYPLTWRAMQAGVDVRHVFGEDAWPCLVFTDLETPPASLATPRWIPTPVPFLYLNAATVGRPSSDTAL